MLCHFISLTFVEAFCCPIYNICFIQFTRMPFAIYFIARFWIKSLYSHYVHVRPNAQTRGRRCESLCFKTLTGASFKTADKKKGKRSAKRNYLCWDESLLDNLMGVIITAFCNSMYCAHNIYNTADSFQFILNGFENNEHTPYRFNAEVHNIYTRFVIVPIILYRNGMWCGKKKTSCKVRSGCWLSTTRKHDCVYFEFNQFSHLWMLN